MHRRARHAASFAAAAAVFALLLGVARVAAASPALPAARAGVATSTNLTPEQQAEAQAELTAPKAAVLGIVEGVTEFLPISSTGHLLIAQHLMGVGASDTTKSAADDYAIVIQSGAILAVLLLYWRRFVAVGEGLVGRNRDGRNLFVALVVAFLPAAVVGFLFENRIKEALFSPWPVIAAWVVGGVALLALSSRGWLERERHGYPLEQLRWRAALVVGLAQILAMWPGTSRSLVTIVAALLVGLELEAAVEFSFLLGFVTLGAATAFDLLKHGRDLFATFSAGPILVGFVFAVVSAVVAIRWMVGYLQRHSLAIFGWYRIAVAGLAAILVVTGRM